jgi:hypothetical protein
MLRDVPENPLLRRRRLLRRSAELRGTLAQQAQVLKAPLALADQVRAGVQWLRRHPEWPIAVAVALTVARPKRALRLVGRLWWAWTSLRRVRSWLALLPQRL